MACNGRPLSPRGEPRASATAQTTVLEDFDESNSSCRISAETAFMLVDAFVARRLLGSRDEPPTDGRSQFSGPDVTSSPVIWPPLVKTVLDP